MEKTKLKPLLKVDDTFTSYQELQEAITRYEKANRLQFWKRDAKRLHRATPRIYEIVKHYPQLEYCNIRYACIHGGQTFKPKNILGFRQRKSKGTWRKDCKAEIFITLNDAKDRLIIKKLIDEHNHDIPTEEVYKQFPKNRRQKTPVNRPLLPNLTPGKQYILDNLVKANSLARSNNFKRIAGVLEEKYKCTVDLQSDDQDKVVGFLFQDTRMKKHFEFFPEILLLDGTYKLQNIGCVIYVMMVENSLGTSDVVGVCVLTLEDQDSVEWMLGTFKNKNPKWKNTVIIVTDRLTSEYEVVPKHFPEVKSLICPSHALQNFKANTSISKILTVTPTESEQCNGFFAKLLEAQTEEEYRTHLEDMEDDIPYPLIEYFLQSWHNLRKEWATAHTPFRTCVNSRFESPNSKLKGAIGSCKTFSRFIENLFVVLYLKKNELKSDVSRMIMKVSVDHVNSKILQKYAKLLTTYAVEKIRLQLSDLLDNEVTNNSFDVSETTCKCDFFTLMKLPCSHLLIYRKNHKLDLFDESLFSPRWTRSYIQSMISAISDDDEIAPQEGEEVPTQKTPDERFEEAQAVCLQLVGLCSEADGDNFERRLAVLMKLNEVWQKGGEVDVGESGGDFSGDHDYVGSPDGESMEVDSENVE